METLQSLCRPSKLHVHVKFGPSFPASKTPKCDDLVSNSSGSMEEKDKKKRKKAGHTNTHTRQKSKEPIATVYNILGMCTRLLKASVSYHYYL